MEKATFGAGCFWCAEAAFKLLKRVVSVTPGYTGGVEAIQVEYDPPLVSYNDLLKIFWEIHDPTQKNQQGPDIGTEYQAVIFVHDDGQRKLAEASKREVEKSVHPVYTEIREFSSFYPAEEYHKDYYARNPNVPYSQIVIAPKVEKVKKMLEHM